VRRAATLVLLVCCGCATASPPSPPHAAVAGGRQSLYRVRYDGGDSTASFRLLLRRASDQRFDLAASDPLGRTLWALEVIDGEGAWFDFRERRLCQLGRSVSLAALHLPDLPLAALPRILAGEAPHAEGADGEGRLWTLRRDSAGALASWEVSDGGKSLVRGERSADGRWTLVTERARIEIRRVAEEPMTSTPARREAPPGFERGECAGLALS
jgi:YD repeat-containing protein